MRPGENEHQYIGRFLSIVKNFARIHNIWIGLVVHPIKITKDLDGEYLVPGAYSLSGSSHWRNKADNILCVYRKLVSPDGVVSVYVQKIRSKLLGTTGEAKFTWDKTSGRFSPLSDKVPYLDGE